MKRTSAEKRWATKYPDLGAAPLPVEPCVSPEYFELERERIFKRAWLCVGRIEEIAQPGEYIVKEIDVTKSSLLIVRGRDDVIRGFHNVCKHRGNKLAPLCRGTAKSFVCGFHGWAYDTTGRLVHVPDEDQFFAFDKADYPLTPVALDVWEGFIFVNLNPQPTESLTEYLGELADQYHDVPFGKMRPVASYAATINANWKVSMDITQESYHVPFLHRKIVPDSNVGGDNPYCHMPSIRIYRRHRASSMYSNPAHQPTPAEAVANKYGATVLEGAADGNTLPAGLNPDGVPNWAFDSNGIFPNFILHVGNGWFITHTYWPVAVDRTWWEYKLYMPPATTPGEKISHEFSKIIARDLARGDLSTLETVQSGLASGVLTHMPLCDQEVLLRHHYKVIDEFVRA